MDSIWDKVELTKENKKMHNKNKGAKHGQIYFFA